MLTYPPTRRQLIVGCSLQMFQQLAGINTVMYVSFNFLKENSALYFQFKRRKTSLKRRSVASPLSELENVLHIEGCLPFRYYSATIMQMSGVRDDRLAIWLAALTAFTNFIFTLVGVWLVEKVGRRKLTLGSLAGTTVALVVLALGFLLSAQASPQVTLHPESQSGQNSTCTKYSNCNGCMLDPMCGFCYKLNKSSVIESSCA
ncbi:hypothetical protein E2320_005832, partial [Naja naja]